MSLFDPIKKSMKAHGMLRPANEFRQRTGMYNRIDDLLKVVPERYQSVINGRTGPLQDAEVELEKLMGLNATGGAESSNSHNNVRLAGGRHE